MSLLSHYVEEAKKANTAAEVLYASSFIYNSLEAEIEEWIYDNNSDEICNFQISYDYYDESVEIHYESIDGSEVAEPEPDDEIRKILIDKYKFKHGWFNFTDGTQIHFSGEGNGIREKGGRNLK